MPPGGQKRKRGDAHYPERHDHSQRPSPHRPQNLGLAQQSHQQSQTYRGGPPRRGSNRGGRGGLSNDGRGTFSTPPTSSNARLSPVTYPTQPSAPAVQPQQAATAPIPQAIPYIRPSNPANVVLPSVYRFSYLTDDRISQWAEKGRQEVLDVAANELEDSLMPSMLFGELIRAALVERIPAAEAGSLVKDILALPGANEPSDLMETFLDDISVAFPPPTSNKPEFAANDVPNPPALRELLIATHIPPDMLRHQLEGYVLIACGFVREAFGSKSIKYQTSGLYKQRAYNLLREESEGYAKLLTEYFDASSRPPTSDMVADTYQRVMSLIGTFDLDAGRVLDVTLDAFANTIIRHNRFFVKYLRASSWWPAEGTWSNVQWSDKLISSLPEWAEPGYEEPEDLDADVARVEDLRQRRDVAFWDRLKAVGVEAWFELGGRRLLAREDREKFSPMEHPKPKDDKAVQETIMQILDNNWIGATGALPPQGNRIAAQLLGFKLRFYASSTRDSTDALPDVLMNLAALLIKIGFISLRDLFPHLYPSTEEEIAKIKAKLREEKAERERKSKPGGGTNALLAAGALTDDTLPPPAPTRLRDGTGNSTPKSNAAAGPDAEKAKEEAKNQLPDPDNQVVILLRNLLLIGAIPESLFLLGKFPWFMDLYPDLPQYVHRLFHQMLSKVYEPLQPLRDRPSVRVAKPQVDNDKAGLPKGHIATTTSEPRKALRWARLEQTNLEGKDYIFYWDDWSDSVPLCQNVDDVFLLCDSLINISGIKIGQDPALLAKLARIGKHSLSVDKSPENNKRWIELSKRLLVPALSLTQSNSPVVNEIFGILQVWPIATRFNIYAEWTTGQTSRLPDVMSAVEQARAQTKDVLKRISKTNTRPMARELAKIADSNPGTVFREAFRQIESYQNMIEVFVECARYLPALGYDVLTWSLMSSLGGNTRSRNQEDGMLTSPWLQALSEFAGSVFKRYPEMHAQSILQYVAFQLKEGNNTDLVVLEQIIDKLAGIQCDVQMNDYQLQAITGGPLLNKLVMEQLQDKRNEASFRPGTRRLINALRQTDDGRPSQLIMLLLVLVAQEVTVFPSRGEVKDAPLKVLGINLDRIYNIFRQYLELLQYNLSTEEFDSQVPDVVDLIEQYHLEPEIAWTIGGRSVRKRVSEVAWPPKTLVNGTNKDNETSSDANMEDASSALPADLSTTKGEPTDDRSQEAQKEEAAAGSHKAEGSPNDDAAMQDIPVAGAGGTEEQEEKTTATGDEQMAHAPPSERQPPSNELMHPLLRSYVDRFERLLPDEVTKHLPIPFYVAFWHLELRDIFVPETAYREERTRSLKAYETALKRPLPRVGASREVKQKQDAELKKVYEGWEQEMKAEEARCNAVKTRLRYERELWFYDYSNSDAHLSLHKALWQDCFFPRILQTGADAHYAFHMMFFLHNSGGTYGKAADGTLHTAQPVPGFRLARLLDDIFQGAALMNTIAALTNREAENFGRFMFKVLEKLHSWQKSRDTFENEAHGKERNLIGFTRKAVHGNDPPKYFMSWDDFRTLLARWNSAVFYALKTCLQSKEYMHIRNAILILKQINPPFPAINFHNSQLKAMLVGLHENDPRPDVKLTAMSCVGDLAKRERFMVSIQNFKGEPEQARNATGKQVPTRTSTPQPSASNKQLNASATEFKPSANGVIKPSGAKHDEDDEEGEIDESKKAEEEKKAAAVAAIASAREKKSEEPAKEPTPAQSSSTVARPSTPASMPPAKGPLPSAASHTATRPIAPSQASTTTPQRPDSARPLSTQPPAQPPHGLPDRPEARLPSSRPNDRLREREKHEHGRLDRPGELIREDRRDRSSSRRSRSKSPERGQASYRDRQDVERGHASGDSRRQDRNGRFPASTNSSREGWPDDAGRAPQDVSGPRYSTRNMSTASQSERLFAPDPAHTERQSQAHTAERPSGPQHGRPPLANETEAFAQRDSRMPDTSRADRESRSERSSRRPSPRADERLPPMEGPRNDWRDNRPAPYGHGRDTRSTEAPTAPRQPPRGPHDLFGPQQAPPRAPSDPNHGRLSQVSPDFAVPPRPDVNLGRLNSNATTPNADTPSGPRGRNAPTRGGRVFTTPGGPAHATEHPNIPPSPTRERDRGLPAGPAAPARGGREHPRRGSKDYAMPTSRSNPSSAPSTPAAEVPASSANAEPLSIHPSRLQNIDAKTTPLQTSGMPSPSGPSSAQPPSGPGMSRGPRGAPPPSGPYSAGPSPVTSRMPTSQGAPSRPGGNMGPAPPMGRTDADRRFTGLNNILQQDPPSDVGAPSDRDRDRRPREGERPPRQNDSNSERDFNRPFRDSDTGASIRGRASRQQSYQSDTKSAPAPNGPPSMPHGGRTNGRADLIDDRGPANADYHDRSGQEGRVSRHRDSGHHRSGSPGRDHGVRDESRRSDERHTRSSRGVASHEQGDGDRSSRRSRDEPGPPRDVEKRTRASGVREEALQPPPMPMGSRGPPRGDDQHWNDDRNGEQRAPRSTRGGHNGEYDSRGGRERKRGRGGDEGPSPDFKRPRRSA